MRRRRPAPRRPCPAPAPGRRRPRHCAGSSGPVPDRGDQRGRDGCPEAPQIVLGRAERDPRRTLSAARCPARNWRAGSCPSLRGRRSGRRRPRPAVSWACRRGRTTTLVASGTANRGSIEPGADRVQTGRSSPSLMLAGGDALTLLLRRCRQSNPIGRETIVSAEYGFRVAGRLTPGVLQVLDPLHAARRLPRPRWWVWWSTARHCTASSPGSRRWGWSSSSCNGFLRIPRTAARQAAAPSGVAATKTADAERQRPWRAEGPRELERAVDRARRSSR